MSIVIALLDCESPSWQYLASNDVNAEIENGQTLLHIACTENQFGVAKLLMKKGTGHIDECYELSGWE